MQEKMDNGILGKAYEEAISGRSARSRWAAIMCDEKSLQSRQTRSEALQLALAVV